MLRVTPAMTKPSDTLLAPPRCLPVELHADRGIALSTDACTFFDPREKPARPRRSVFTSLLFHSLTLKADRACRSTGTPLKRTNPDPKESAMMISDQSCRTFP